MALVELCLRGEEGGGNYCEKFFIFLWCPLTLLYNTQKIYLIAILFCIHISFTVQKENTVNCHHTVVASMGQRGVTHEGPPSPTICNVVVEAVLRDWFTLVVDAVFLHWVTLVEATKGY